MRLVPQHVYKNSEWLVTDEVKHGKYEPLWAFLSLLVACLVFFALYWLVGFLQWYL